MRRFSTVSLVACVLAAVLALQPVAVPATAAAADDAATSSYVPLQPCRLLDTRSAAGSRVAPGLTMTLPIADRCGVPGDAVAAAISVTVVGTAGAGFLTVWPADQPQPLASTVTWSQPGDTRANGAVIQLSAAGSISIFANAPTDVVVDVSGAFVPGDSARSGRFVPITPARLLDTRTTSRPGPATSVTVPRPAGVPADAIALAVGITTTESTGPGFFTAYAAGATRPNASVLNTTGAGQTVASTAIVPISAQGMSVFTQAGDHVIVDVFGWFTGTSAATSSDGLFVPATPTRVLDTRTGGVPVYTNGSVPVPLGTAARGAAAIVANVTATQSRGSGFVTAFPTRTARPLVSSLNYVAGQSVANMAIVAASTAGVSVYANRTADLIVDVTGWFTGEPMTAVSGAADANVAPASPELPGCPATGRAAIGDKAAQRFWLCQDGYPVTDALPMTTGGLAYFRPPVGTYRVFAKLPTNTGIHGERLYRFVAFYTTPRGNRIAFHEVVHQSAESVGDLAMRGASSGCFRLRRDDSIKVWDFLQIGDPVIIITP
ncbi:MAG: L,D-transpeptidase [Actinobacteria bacterium]|nr:L,D-transpeptidase [Actinomycetota bacterium]